MGEFLMADAELPDPPIGYHQEALVYYPGDGMPLVLTDEMTMADLAEYLPEMRLRTFFVRIATWADRVDAFMDASEDGQGKG